MSSRPPEYNPSQYPPYVPPEASQASAPLSDAPPFAPLSPEQAKAAFAELVDPFAPVVSAQAIFSVIFAIVGATLLPVFAQVVSILLGARALRRIKRSDGAIIGRRLAWAENELQEAAAPALGADLAAADEITFRDDANQFA